MSYPKPIKKTDLQIGDDVKVAGAIGNELQSAIVTDIKMPRVIVRYKVSGAERDVSFTRLRR